LASVNREAGEYRGRDWAGPIVLTPRWTLVGTDVEDGWCARRVLPRLPHKPVCTGVLAMLQTLRP
ncbi:MAG: hypothetical protein ACRDXB_20300, partial [Actinomycetes bacterium]